MAQAGAGALATVLGLLALRAWLHRGLTPPRLPHPPPPPAPATDPAQPPPERVHWCGPNGRKLHALWLPMRGDRVAVLMHGWGGNGSTLWPAAQALHAAGWSVLLPDARGHGLSEADTHSSLPRFAQDLDSAVAWVRHTGGKPQARVVLVGHSVGAAAALLSASRRSDLCAVVAVSSFDHPEHVMRRWLRAHHVPYWPLGWAVNRYVEQVIGHHFDDIAPLHTVAHVSCPVLLVHGTRDTVVPLDALHALQRANPWADVWATPGDHDHFDHEPQLLRELCEWLHNRCH